MTARHDLLILNWTVSGWAPHGWRFLRSMETGASSLAEFPPIPVRVPGSVQQALLDAGVIDDWNSGMKSLKSEWVENRHWIYSVKVPGRLLPAGESIRLRCDGLDYSGWILANGAEIAHFEGSFVPHAFDLSLYAGQGDLHLEIVFDVPPRWLGQFGYTSEMTDWKPRYNYTWDWTTRLVQIGIWDAITLEIGSGRIEELHVSTCYDRGAASLTISAMVDKPDGAFANINLTTDAEPKSVQLPATDLARGVTLTDLPVSQWHPNGNGAQPLYDLTVQLVDEAGSLMDLDVRTVGFRRIEWKQCEGAPAGAEPWICVVNGKPTFLQGVNWTPILPNFADVPDSRYEALLTQYRDLGVNMVRVWGGGFLEKEIFYDLCDRLGILVWQEFPLSSSGAENWPPEDEKSISEMEPIVRSYIDRRSHHASLALWCGGNELQGGLDGSKLGVGKPVDIHHPMMGMMGRVVAEADPERRFLPTSSSGPRFMADRADFGKGLHHDVHGPWGLGAWSWEEWESYWTEDDALFRSETGCPGASGVDIIRAYRGECDEVPGTLANPLWRRTSWWIEWPAFTKEAGREPEDLEEYVAWSQARQTKALSIAVGTTKRRFPRCGGILLWMGHDSFPCPANTAIIDFLGRPKPAALAVSDIWKAPAGPASHS